MQELANDIVSSDFVKGVVDIFTKIIQSIDDVVDHLGAIPIILGVIGAGFGIKKWIDGSQIASIKDLAANIELLTQKIVGNTAAQERNNQVKNESIISSEAETVATQEETVAEEGNTLANQSDAYSEMMEVQSEFASAASSTAETVATQGKPVSESVGLFSKLIDGLKSKILGINPIIAMLGVAVAASGVAAYVSYKYFNRYNEALDNAKKSAEDAQKDISDVESKLSNVKSQIDAIKSDGVITITEQADLDRLEQENKALELQLQYRKLIAEEKNQDVVDAAKDKWNDEFASTSSQADAITYGQMLTGANGMVGAGFATINADTTPKTKTERVAEAYSKALESQQKAQSELDKATEIAIKDGKTTEEESKQIAELTAKEKDRSEELKLQRRNRQEQLDAIQEQIDNLSLTKDGRESDEYKQALEQQKYLTSVDPESAAAWNEIQISSVISSLGLSEEDLRELAKEAEESIPDDLMSDYNKELAEAIKLGYLDEDYQFGDELAEVVIGNIDTAQRKVLDWNKENVNKFSDALLSWGENPEDYFGSYSTVDSRSDNFDGVEIAFTPIFLGENGPEYLDSDTVYNYIDGLIKQANSQGLDWKNDESILLNLDKKENGGKGLLFGQDLNGTEVISHLAGKYGSLASMQNEMNKYTDDSVLSNSELVKSLDEESLILDENQDKISIVNQYLNAYKTSAEEADTVTGKLSRTFETFSSKFSTLSLNEDDFKSFKSTLKELNDELDDDSANDLALDYYAFSLAAQDLQSNLESYSDVFKTYSEDSYEYSDALNHLRDDISALTGVDYPLTDALDFSKDAESMELLEEAINGNDDALKQLQVRAQELKMDLAFNDFISVDANLNTLDFRSQMNDFSSWLDTVDLGTLEAQAELDDQPFIQSLMNALSAAQITAKQANAIMDKMGWEVHFSKTTLDVPNGFKWEDHVGTRDEGSMGRSGLKLQRIQYQSVDFPSVYYTNTGGGGKKPSTIPSHITPSKSSNSGGGGGGSDSKPSKETFDWIEVRLQRIQEKLDKLKTTAETTWESWGGKNGRDKALNQEIKQYQKLIDANTTAGWKYLEKANSIGLSEDWAKKVRDGQFSIEDVYDDDLKEKISEYQNWYNKALESFNAADEARLNKVEAYLQKWENLVTKYNQKVEKIQTNREIKESKWDARQNINRINSKAIKSYYKDERSSLNSELKASQQHTKDLQKQLKELQKNGVKKNSEEWNKLNQEILESKKNTADLQGELKKLNIQEVVDQFDKIYSDLEWNNTKRNQKISIMQNAASLAEAKGNTLTSAYYKYQNNVLNSQNKDSKAALKDLQGQITEGLKRDKDFYNSDEYRDLVKQMYDLQLEIQENEITIQNNTNAIRQLKWDRFDRYIEYIDDMKDSISDFADVISNEYSKITDDDTGRLTSQGKSLVGLTLMQRDSVLSEKKFLEQQIKDVQNDLKNDPTNQTLQDRLKTLQSQMRDLTAEEMQLASQAKSYLETQYNAMLEAMQKVIDKRKEELNATKDLYDYQKNVEGQTRNIAKLRKQLLAFEGDNSSENVARVQKLQVQLQQAEESLKETEWERQISEEQTMMDNLYDEFDNLLQSILNQPLHDILHAIEDGKLLNIKDSEVLATIKDVGTDLSISVPNLFDQYFGSESSLSKILIGDGSINKETGEYTQGLLGSIQTANSNIATVAQNTATTTVDNQATADKNAYNDNVQKKWNDAKSFYKKLRSSYGYDLNGKAGGKKNGKGYISKADRKTLSQKLRAFLDLAGIKYTNYSTKDSDAKQIKALRAMAKLAFTAKGYTVDDWKKNGFAKGGTIGKAIKSTGEDGFILARTGEEVLSLDKIKGMNEVLEGFKPLAAALPNLKNISNANSSTSVDNLNFTITLPNVTDYDGFKKELQNDKNFQKWTQEITIGQSLGNNSLNYKRY